MNRTLHNTASLGFFLALVGAVLFSLSIAGCASSSDDTLRGEISYANGLRNADDDYYCDYFYCYIYLDDDTDITNGYAALKVIEITSACTSIEYEMDTSNVPAGSYYLLAAYDFDSTLESMHTDSPYGWEAIGWYGSDTTSPPATGSVAPSGEYDIALHGLS
jgi:hypothetical protein